MIEDVQRGCPGIKYKRKRRTYVRGNVVTEGEKQANGSYLCINVGIRHP